MTATIIPFPKVPNPPRHALATVKLHEYMGLLRLHSSVRHLLAQCSNVDIGGEGKSPFMSAFAHMTAASDHVHEFINQEATAPNEPPPKRA